MKLQAEKDRLIGFIAKAKIYSSYGKDQHKSIFIETNAITKEVLYVVFNNGDEVLKTSDLDDAIAKFNKY